MLEKLLPKSRNENLIVQELDGDMLVYDLKTNKAVCLNNTSALVWQACDGSRTIAEIGDTVGKQLNSQINEDIVWLALDQLSKENLIENQPAIESKFNGLSRRDVIRKVGLASIVALPLVTSMVAPLAAHAASTCTVVFGGCTCTQPTSGSRPQGSQCTAAVACANSACRCVHGSANGSTAGSCVP